MVLSMSIRSNASTYSLSGLPSVVVDAPNNASKDLVRESEVGTVCADEAPFTIHYKSSTGASHTIEAKAVIDASGTWYSPNPIGTNGLPVAGEVENAAYITYGIPDVLDQARGDQRGLKLHGPSYTPPKGQRKNGL